MRLDRLLLLVLVVGAGAAAAGGVTRTPPAVRTNLGKITRSSSQTGLLSLFPPSGRGLFAGQDPCDVHAGELVGNSFCLRGDGTQRSAAGMTLSAVGSPVTETRAVCPNGSDCKPMTAQRTDGSTQYFLGPTTAIPAATSFSMCWLGQIYDFTGTPHLISKYSSSAVGQAFLSVNTNGAPSINVSNGTTTIGASGANGIVLLGALHLICGTYQWVADGSSVEKMYLDGVQVGATQTAGPAVNQPGSPPVWRVDARSSGGQVVNGRTVAALYTEKLLSPTTIAAMAATVRPPPTGTRGEPFTCSRASLATLTASTGEMSTASNNVCEIVGGGVYGPPSITNLVTLSQDLTNAAWTKSGATATADVAVARDGSTTADRCNLSSGTSIHECYFGLSYTSGTTYTISRYLKSDGTWQFVQILGSSTAFGSSWWTNIDLSNCSVTQTNGAVPVTVQSAGGGWCKVVLTVTSASSTAGERISTAFAASGTSGRAPSFAGDGTSGFYIWGEQSVTGTQPGPYCPTNGSAATCLGSTNTTPKPTTLSLTEGCACVSFRPNWSGQNTTGSNMYVLLGNSGLTARFVYILNNATSPSFYNGTNAVQVTTSRTAGVLERYCARWSASANKMRLDNMVGGNTSPEQSFSGFPSFDSTISVGGTYSGSGQPDGVISDIKFGQSFGECQ
jgi:hypothetical protein